MQRPGVQSGSEILSSAPQSSSAPPATPSISIARQGPGLAAQQLSALVAELLKRRDRILDAWRAAGEAAGECSIASSLSRNQFNDHIPAVLDCLAHTIESSPAEQDADRAGIRSGRVCDHGLQRWQQGYPLRDLIREWGHLQICVAEELERFAAANPSLEPGVMPTARRAWTRLCADGVTESATQYWHLHQTESAGHVHDLERALEAVQAIEQSRAEAWRRAAHDLRGSVTVVRGAATLLNHDTVYADESREEVTSILNTSITSLHDMLNDLLNLARLEAGHDQRELTTFDAAALMRDFCGAAQASASERGLFLKMDGPDTLEVESDRTKVLRILQNLFLNALKYTQRGGIRVTWGLDHGRDTDRWTFSVQDTGPGLDENEAAPFAQELLGATNVADEAREAGTDPGKDIPAASTLPSRSMPLSAEKQPGEGVGLSIVKRLCELLDASLELATSPGQGTTFRVILPRAYDRPPA